MNPTSLYLCYQSLLEPLTQTQVVAYLEGLAQAGYGVVLLTFEPKPLGEEEVKTWGERLSGKGIIWYSLPYHKRPTVPATAWDVLAGVWTGLRLIRRHRVGLVHARAHVPGVMGLILKRLTGVKLLFDVRGLMAEEYADAGVWPAGGLLFRATKRAERALVKAADGVVVLTHRAQGLLEEWYPRELAGKPVEVIPCCADLRDQPAPPFNREDGPTFVYAGKLGGWYLTEEMVAFVARATEVLPNLRWQVWTQSDPAPLRRLLVDHDLEGRTTIGQKSPEALRSELAVARAGLSFIKPCLSKIASSPTKIAEYLAAGLPVVSTAGIGDTDRLLGRGETAGPTGDGPGLGVILEGEAPEDYRRAAEELRRLLDDPDTPCRCRAAARDHFDLETVGWTRYRRLYAALTESARNPGRVPLPTDSEARRPTTRARPE